MLPPGAGAGSFVRGGVCRVGWSANRAGVLAETGGWVRVGSGVSAGVGAVVLVGSGCGVFVGGTVTVVVIVTAGSLVGVDDVAVGEGALLVAEVAGEGDVSPPHPRAPMHEPMTVSTTSDKHPHPHPRRALLGDPYAPAGPRTGFPVVSSTQNRCPFGACGHDGSGAHPFSGTHPAGGVGHPSGGLNRAPLERVNGLDGIDDPPNQVKSRQRRERNLRRAGEGMAGTGGQDTLHGLSLSRGYPQRVSGFH